MKPVTNKVLVTVTSLGVFKLSKLGHGWKVAETSLLSLKLERRRIKLYFPFLILLILPAVLVEIGKKALCPEKVSQSIHFYP